MRHCKEDDALARSVIVGVVPELVSVAVAVADVVDDGDVVAVAVEPPRGMQTVLPMTRLGQVLGGLAATNWIDERGRKSMRMWPADPRKLK